MLGLNDSPSTPIVAPASFPTSFSIFPIMRERCASFARTVAATMRCSTPNSRLNCTSDSVSFGKHEPP